VANGVKLQEVGAKIITTKISKTGVIILEVDAAEDADLLAEKFHQVVGSSARVVRPERRTSVLLLGISEWEDEEAIKSTLIHADVTPQELVYGRKYSISSRTNSGLLWRAGCQALTLAGAGHVVVGLGLCFRCQEQGHISAECIGSAKPHRCYRCQTEGHLSGACTGLAKTREKPIITTPATK